MQNLKPKNYNIVHIWIRSKYGKASKCEFCKSDTAKNFEWALKKNSEYKKDIGCFLQLCVSCHRKYDYTEVQREKNSLNMSKKIKDGIIDPRWKGRFGASNPHSKRIVQKNIDGSIVREYSSLSEAYPYGFKTTAISMCLTGKNKTSGGFKWEYIK